VLSIPLLQLYTAAINACALCPGQELTLAQEVYSLLQRYDVTPDDLLYGNLIALAGRAKALDVAFEFVEDMRASGLRPGSATCSALVYACIQNNNLPAARKVFDTLAERGVLPHISQFNALMEQYALRYRLGTVSSLLGRMMEAGVKPNPNTYRILILACQRAQQSELAYEVFQICKGRGLLQQVGLGWGV
jgi:leucine-rich PPR motif-containing protein